jgi:hypothetical protein
LRRSGLSVIFHEQGEDESQNVYLRHVPVSFSGSGWGSRMESVPDDTCTRRGPDPVENKGGAGAPAPLIMLISLTNSRRKKILPFRDRPFLRPPKRPSGTWRLRHSRECLSCLQTGPIRLWKDRLKPLPKRGVTRGVAL